MYFLNKLDLCIRLTIRNVNTLSIHSEPTSWIGIRLTIRNVNYMCSEVINGKKTY